MTGKQETVIQHNAAWRAFWIKIRELNAREAGGRKEEGENSRPESPSAADEAAGSALTGSGKPATKSGD